MNHFQCRLSHFLHFFRISQKLQQRLLKGLLIRRHNAYASFGKELENFLEIEHIGTYKHRLPVGCRFQDVMAPYFYKAATHKNHIRQAVETSQFADGIQNDDLGALPVILFCSHLERRSTV